MEIALNWDKVSKLSISRLIINKVKKIRFFISILDGLDKAKKSFQATVPLCKS